MLLIYTPHITQRSQYVFEHIFGNYWGITYTLTDNKMFFEQSIATAKLVYAQEPINKGLFFYASGLLEATQINFIPLQVGEYAHTPSLFAHTIDNAAMPFDIFSAVFYLLSRYEEYTSTKKDQWGNFDYRESILYQLQMLDKPLVDEWLQLLKQILQIQFPKLIFQEKEFNSTITIDVDVAYQYCHKGWIRTAGSLGKKIITGKWLLLKEQIFTLLGFQPDAFNTFNYIFEKANKQPIFFFFNVGKYGAFDKNPSIHNTTFQQLIRSIHQKATVGLHPSYASNSDYNLLESEKNALEHITKQSIHHSRQHYLKLNLPHTYRHLAQLGITDDYTMGYYSTWGFRAGTCHPFYFFDIEANKTTPLRLHPFAFMDGTLNTVLQLSTNEALLVIDHLIQTVQQYNGTFIPLWHNSTLSEKEGWQGWRKVFEHMLQQLT